MNTRAFTGAITALVTPFKGGKVAWDYLDSLVDRQIEEGIQGLVPVGTTGESPTLDHEEHLDVVRAVVKRAAGRVPVLAGTGSNSTREAVDLTRQAHEAGADGMLVVAPYYNKPGPDGLFAHFSALADVTDRPIVLYSIPSRCGIEIPVSVVERLRARHDHVNHIKEAGGSVDRVDRLVEALGDDLVVLSGDDSLTLPFMAVGARGVISVASNVIPAEVRALVDAASAGRLDDARARHRRLYPLFKALFLEPNPVPVKHALARRGWISDPSVRLPLSSISDEVRGTVDETLDTLGVGGAGR